MAIVDSLKKLLVKFGGNPSALEENATSSDVIDAITEAYTDKEGTYTEVTPVVTEGTKIATIKTNNTDHDIYAPAASGGSSVFDIHITYDETAGVYESPFVSDKTFDQIAAAFANGDTLRLFAVDPHGGDHSTGTRFYMPLADITYKDDDTDFTDVYSFTFSFIYYGDGVLDFTAFWIAKDEDTGNTLVYQQFIGNILPSN